MTSLWTSQTSASNNAWDSVTYGNGIFMAVSYTGNENRVMTSTNGITWDCPTSRSYNLQWQSVTYGNGIFVAVATNNTMRSTDNGITWTTTSAAANNEWASVTYGNGLFVAVSSNGTNQVMKVMTSPDGITWTSQASAANNNWVSVTYGNPNGIGIFVAVAYSGTGNRVMTSPDGITWTIQTSAADNNWISVTYGNPNGIGIFVAVAASGTGNRVMTSLDGITWTLRTSAADNTWRSVTFGNGQFVVVSSNGTDQVMTSPDGITWTSQASAADNSWRSVTFGQSNGIGLFVAVSETGTGNRVMTANTTPPTIGPLIIPSQMYIGETFTIIDPSSNSDGSFNYTSSNPSVETISSRNILTAVGVGSTTITATQAATDEYTSGSVYAISNTCFPAGTLISCNQGFIPIELINPDIHTIRGKKIVTITKTIIQNKYLICFEKGSLGNNIPNRQTIMSKNHQLFYNGKMIKAAQFADKFENVKKIKYTGEVLYNVLMENHDKMVVHNLICETLNPEHDLAKLHTILKDMSSSNKIKFIQKYNKMYIEKNKIQIPLLK